jgi:hypothetical protein
MSDYVISSAGEIVRGSTIIVNLHSPREKLWGILFQINSSGVFMRGVDLNTFDEWVRLIARGEPNVGLTSLFLPLWRVDRILLDESIDDIRSLADQFHQRVGMTIEQYIQTITK